MNHNGSRYHAKTDLGKDGILSPERQLGEPTSSQTNSPACHRTKQGNPCSTNRMPLNVYENNKTNHLHCLTTAIINHILLHKFQNSASTYKPHNKHTKQNWSTRYHQIIERRTKETPSHPSLEIDEKRGHCCNDTDKLEEKSKDIHGTNMTPNIPDPLP